MQDQKETYNYEPFADTEEYREVNGACIVSWVEVMRDKGIARSGMTLVGGGLVTSGGYSPMLDVGIGLAYVPTELAETGRELLVDIRGRQRRAEIVDKPIYRPES